MKVGVMHWAFPPVVGGVESHLIYLYNNVHYVFFQKTVKGLNALGVVGGLEVDWTQVYVAG